MDPASLQALKHEGDLRYGKRIPIRLRLKGRMFAQNDRPRSSGPLPVLMDRVMYLVIDSHGNFRQEEEKGNGS